MAERGLGKAPTVRGVLAGVVAAVVAACGGPDGEAAPTSTAPAPTAGALAPGTDPWEGVQVDGLQAGSELWDVAVDNDGGFVAVGSLGWVDGGHDFAIWRSDDGRSWEEVFRRPDPLGEDDAFVGIRSEVVAHDEGFAVVAADCPDACTPVAFHSPDGRHWTEVDVPARRASGGDARPAPSGAGGGVGPTFAGRVVRATPDYTLQGAQMLNVVASGDRLVAVGWAETAGEFTTGFAVWWSDDGGRTWEQAPEGTFSAQGSREELNRVVRAGDRVVAGGGNRCCYDQPVGGLWVAGEDGERWRAVPFPDGQTVSIFGLAAAGDAVHVVGTVDVDRERVQWRLSAGDRWERLPDPPAVGRFLAGGDGFELVAAVGEYGDQRLVRFTSAAGKHFRPAQASARRTHFGLETALLAGGRVLAYVTVGEDDDQRRLLFIGD